MEETELLPHLFRTEYRKIVSVLCHLFGIEHIETAEDIVSDTFLAATELWGIKGLPENPVAWLYTVAKNKTKNYLKRDALFAQKLAKDIKYSSDLITELEIDLSPKSIQDSQLAMMFTVCNPCISTEAQIALALSLLCGFGIQEIADAFLTNKEVIYKRISRAKEKLKEAQIRIQQPSQTELDSRLDNVLTTLYLLFNEGYYSRTPETVLREDLCFEAMRLNYLLIENESTNKPQVNALLSLMCFHSSRFEARRNEKGESVLYDDQDTNLWNKELIDKGIYYLNMSSQGKIISKYHLEACIAYWHTHKEDTAKKWEHILQLYNQLLLIEYSPIAALNRTFALAKANGKKMAVAEAEKLELNNNPFYFSLLAYLYAETDPAKALLHYESALLLSVSNADKQVILSNIRKLKEKPFLN
ncbi:MAG: sigma-70 family RNA polymerase sigma factor [Bacteroidota bacterium]